MFFQTSPWIGMPAQPARYTPAATDTVVHDLPPIRFDGQPIDIRLSLRRSEDGIWRGRILFGAEGTEAERSSAEIFCAATTCGSRCGICGITTSETCTAPCFDG